MALIALPVVLLVGSRLAGLSLGAARALIYVDGMLNRRIRLRDIARKLGISHTAVGLALRNHHSISAKRRAQVKRVAEKLGYRPDPLLVSLAYHRRANGGLKFQGSLAWVRHGEQADRRKTHEYYAEVWRGASEAAARLGYRLEEVVRERDCSPKRYERILLARGIQGILIPTHDIAPDWGDFDWSKFSIIRFGLSVPVPDSNLVTTDQFRSVVMAMSRMRQYGYERIGLVVGRRFDSLLGGSIIGGFRWAQMDLKLRPALPILLTDYGKFDAFGMTAQRNALQHWIEKHSPDAILTTDAEIPDLIRGLGCRIPQDVAVAATTVSDIPVDAGIDLHSEAVGRIAIEALIKQIKLNECGEPSDPTRILVEGFWRDGASLPPRSGSRKVRRESLLRSEEVAGSEIKSAARPDRKRVTVYDIARKLGVAHSTVALALHGNPRISASRREQVELMARQMGYEHDPRLSSLAAYRSSKTQLRSGRTLAWIWHWQQPDFRNSLAYFAGLWKGAAEAADRLGYQLEAHCITSDMTLKQFEQHLLALSIQGLLICPHDQPPDWHEFEWSRFSIVRLGMSVPFPDANVVTADGFRATVRALSNISQAGYSRIGLVISDYDGRIGGNAAGGFLAAQLLLHIKPALPPLIFGSQKEQQAKALKSWLKKYHPDAILTTEAQVPELIRKLGYRIPQDVAVAGLSIDVPVDAGMDQHPEAVGRVAVETLVKQMHVNERGVPPNPVRILVESRWRNGKSLLVLR